MFRFVYRDLTSILQVSYKYSAVWRLICLRKKNLTFQNTCHSSFFLIKCSLLWEKPIELGSISFFFLFMIRKSCSQRQKGPVVRTGDNEDTSTSSSRHQIIGMCHFYRFEIIHQNGGQLKSLIHFIKLT